MDLNRLGQATATEHAPTEETVPVMSASLSAAEYVDVLRRFYRVVSAWDRWADAHVPDDLRDMLSSRRRASLLADTVIASAKTMFALFWPGDGPGLRSSFRRGDVARFSRATRAPR